jgi:hypothetical protein
MRVHTPTPAVPLGMTAYITHASRGNDSDKAAVSTASKYSDCVAAL